MNGSDPTTGAYSLTGLADGSYDVLASAPGFAYGTELGVAVVSGSGGPGHDFALVSAGKAVVFGFTTSPLGDVTVKLSWNGFSIASVDADPATGEFAFDPVPEGTYSVFFTDGTNTYTALVDVVAGVDTGLGVDF